MAWLVVVSVGAGALFDQPAASRRSRSSIAPNSSKGPTSGRSRVWATVRSAHGTRCEARQRGPFVYHWPIKPFDRQHPIRGYFGDPRTVGLEQLGMDHAGSLGSFTFHGGIDIVATPGTPVYAVVTGIAHVKSGDFISITTGTGRTFQYAHLAAAVTPGNR